MKASVSVKITRKIGAVGEVEVALTGDRLIDTDNGGLVEFEELTNTAETMIKHYMEHHTTNTRIIGGEAGDMRMLPALKIVVNMKDGKKLYNVKNDQYQEFGVPFYTEHMKQCGIDPRNIPDDGYALKEGTTMQVEFVGDKPKRVIKLVRPIQS